MTLYLEQPALHDLNCRECAKYIYEPDKGWTPLVNQAGEKKRRFGPTPCRICPKENPQKAPQHELSDKNYRAYQFYLLHRALNFNALSDQEKQDPIVQRNMQIIDTVVRRFEQKQQLQQTMLLLTASLPAPGAKKP